MENNFFKSDNISIKNLLLWDENARFPDKYFNKSEKELIDYFISKKDFKIKEFAEAIVKDFDLPQIEKIVVYKLGNKSIVLEGNRRLTAYKLLSNPNLTDDVKLKDVFKRLKSQITITNNLALECLITENKKEGLRYIDRPNNIKLLISGCCFETQGDAALSFAHFLLSPFEIFFKKSQVIRGESLALRAVGFFQLKSTYDSN